MTFSARPIALSLAVFLGCLSASAHAQPEPPLGPSAPLGEPVRPVQIGIGYKIGNGIGFVGGDIIVALFGHVHIDLQANHISYSGASGFGLAPTLQYHFTRPSENSLYVGAGLQYAQLALDGVTGRGTGFVANLGYSWRWRSGLGILLGGGVQHMPEVTASDGNETIERKGGTTVNLEFGVRYFF